MIISASRRTDIPAFYSEWFLNRIKAGFVDVQNPMNPQLVSRVPLNSRSIDCIVFWTKNVAPMLPFLSKIDALNYPYYFQFTITPYGKELEPNLPAKKEIISSFQLLSRYLGKERVIWRYDPIVVAGHYTVNYHIEQFDKMAEMLAGYTERCVISFVDMYKKFSRAKRAGLGDGVEEQDMLAMAEYFAKSARLRNIQLTTCAEAVDLHAFDILPEACIDARTLEKVTGQKFNTIPDNQRLLCSCLKCVDIGAYSSCTHGCVYCYATGSLAKAIALSKAHSPDFSMLTGNPVSGQKVVLRPAYSLIKRQLTLL